MKRKNKSHNYEKMQTIWFMVVVIAAAFAAFSQLKAATSQENTLGDRMISSQPASQPKKL